MDNYFYELLQKEIQCRKELHCFKHDFINHVNVIQMYIEMNMSEKAIEYINKLTKFMESHSFNCVTGNTEFDIIISKKLERMREMGVELDVEAFLPEIVNVDIFDIATILGNLLDNAHEALQQAQIKKLSLDINLIDNELNIIISNTHSNIINQFNDEIFTSKKDFENHGLGLSSVKNCVNKNNGNINVSFDENYFTVEVYIPILENVINC